MLPYGTLLFSSQPTFKNVKMKPGVENFFKCGSQPRNLGNIQFFLPLTFAVQLLGDQAPPLIFYVPWRPDVWDVSYRGLNCTKVLFYLSLCGCSALSFIMQ
jgi:hypothetical protein